MQTASNDIQRHNSGFGYALGAGVAVLATTSAWWLADTALEVVSAAMRGTPVVSDDALLALAAGVAAAGSAWLAVGVLLELLAAFPGALGRAARTIATAVSPALVRRAVGVVLGVGLGAGVGAGPAVASQARAVCAAVHQSGAAPGTTPLDASPLPDPGWAPATPEGKPRHDGPRGEERAASHPDVTAATAASGRQAAGTTDGVVVRRGDSLWAIAARHLGGEATDRAVAAAWPRWYEANRRVVGPDPDLIVPGQVLLPPPTEDHP